jgi:hypothetical protein
VEIADVVEHRGPRDVLGDRRVQPGRLRELLGRHLDAPDVVAVGLSFASAPRASASMPERGGA